MIIINNNNNATNNNSNNTSNNNNKLRLEVVVSTPKAMCLCPTDMGRHN